MFVKEQLAGYEGALEYNYFLIIILKSNNKNNCVEVFLSSVQFKHISKAVQFNKLESKYTKSQACFLLFLTPTSSLLCHLISTPPPCQH